MALEFNNTTFPEAPTQKIPDDGAAARDMTAKYSIESNVAQQFDTADITGQTRGELGSVLDLYIGNTPEEQSTLRMLMADAGDGQLFKDTRAVVEAMRDVLPVIARRQEELRARSVLHPSMPKSNPQIDAHRSEIAGLIRGAIMQARANFIRTTGRSLPGGF